MAKKNAENLASEIARLKVADVVAEITKHKLTVLHVETPWESPHIVNFSVRGKRGKGTLTWNKNSPNRNSFVQQALRYC